MPKEKLQQLAHDFMESHALKQVDNIMNLFVADGNIHYWGASVGEEGFSREALQTFFERDFAEAENITFSIDDLTVFDTEFSGVIIGNWQINYQLKGEVDTQNITLRTTLYAELINECWKIRHAHWSVAYGEGLAEPASVEVEVSQ
ncbi:MAG: nuclear transport factor 2 family protein [Parashewanella sp.]